MGKSGLATPPPLLIVISGPAGVGKDSVVNRMKEQGYPFHFVVTATDRSPRSGEVNGVDYFFFSTAEFERMEREGELLEHAIVYGQHKGIPKQQVRQALASGQDVVMRLDVQGAATVRQLVPQAVLIFLTASEQELEQRLHRRAADSPQQLAMRIAKARDEIAQLPLFDYVVANHEDRLDEAVAQVAAIITAEHCRVQPRIVQL